MKITILVHSAFNATFTVQCNSVFAHHAALEEKGFKDCGDVWQASGLDAAETLQLVEWIMDCQLARSA